MGDRANVLVKSGKNHVYLYTHWSGYNLPQIVQSAMKRGKNRWDDSQYLTRIIFCEMIKDSVMDETGYGISSEVGDGDNRIVTVNVDEQMVNLKGYKFPGYKGSELSFTDFVSYPLKDQE
jgi:hypothetical protein